MVSYHQVWFIQNIFEWCVIVGREVWGFHSLVDLTQCLCPSALLKLSDPPLLTPALTPICLPDSPELSTFTFGGMKCYASGWGKTHLQGALHDHLQEIEVPVQPQATCAEAYNTAQYGFVKLSDAHLCAGVLDGSAGTCIVSSYDGSSGGRRAW